MKLRFLCANHREWLSRQPDQAVHRCANSLETGWDLLQAGRWKEALPHTGCAYETAEILMTTRAIAPAKAVAWFLHSLAGLTQALEKLDRINECLAVYQAAVARLRHEATQNIDPELAASINLQITRLQRERRQMNAGGISGATTPARRLTLVEPQRGDHVLH